METELTPSMTLVLMVLIRGARHGYAIMTEIASITGGDYSVPPGTLYRSLVAMCDLGVIEMMPGGYFEGDDQRRKYYRITDEGRAAVKAEFERMDRLLRKAKSEGIFEVSVYGN